MTTKNFPNGLGGTLGDQLDTCKPFMTSGNVWYVNSVTGTDAGGTAGQNREAPLATVQQAITNAADDDIIVLLSTHTQTLAAGVTVAKRLTLVGEGSSGGKPLVKFSVSNAAIVGFTATTTNVEFRNLYFADNATGGIAYVQLGAAQCRIAGCYFEQSIHESFCVTLAAGADRARVENCTFVSMATSIATQPLSALLNSAATNDVEVLNTTFNSGAFGWSSYAFSMNNAALRLKVLGLNLLGGADVLFNASNTGYLNVQSATAGSRVDWT